tara:strand:+ start:347 stop:1492 length:1146 start_codon:yes stop_codon:yes gene_type:complete
MNKEKIWLSSPHIGTDEMSYIEDAFASNWISTLGSNVDGFEDDLENYLSESDASRSSVCVLNSGTSAIHLALILLGVNSEDEVICQSFTFAASANPILYLGAIPVFVDSEPITFGICPTQLEKAILDRIAKGKKPKAIIAVHTYGMLFEVEKIIEISKKYNIPLLEDAASALGSSFKGKKCGTFGDIGVVSFNGNKIITTSGGGALISKSAKIKKKAIFLASQARDKAPHYQHSNIGYNYRMSNISASIGRGQMKILESHIAKRRITNQFYKSIFKDIKGVAVFKEPNTNYYSNFWLTIICIDKSHKITKEQLRLNLLNENIESRSLWKPLHLQPIFSTYPYYGSTIAEDLFETGLCLPSGSNMTEAQKNKIKKTINKTFT